MAETFLEIALRVEADIKARKQAEARGITANDVRRVFPGARILSDLTCRCCGGRMVERLERRHHVLACGRCGRVKK
jgi:hypothetical protein